MALIFWGELPAATDITMATAVRQPGADTRQAIIDLIGPVAADVLATNPSIQAAVANLIIANAGVMTSASVTATYEIAVGDAAGNPTWMQAKANGDPSDHAAKTMRRFVGVHTGPFPSDYAQPGEKYLWFVTDPVTGQLIDIRNGAA